MKKILLLTISLLIINYSIHAQEVVSTHSQGEVSTHSQELASTPEQETFPIKVKHEIAEPEFDKSLQMPVLQNDSLHLPLLNDFGQVPSYNYLGMYPNWGVFSSWRLHEGLNVNMGASVFAEFGKHAHHGAGFGQNIALQYATPLTDKLSLSVGGYINNIYWQRDTYRNAGFSAVLGYRFNEKWEAYVYGQKSIIQTNNFFSRPMYYWDEVGDKIGAAVKYNFSESFSVQLSVEEHSYPQYHMPRYNPQFGNTSLPSEQYFNR